MVPSNVICVLCWMFVIKVKGKVTDEEYSLMPPLFHLDDFDRCMLLGEQALYCSVTIQLAPMDSNRSRVWRIIQEVISDKKNYRHDQLRHGVCVPHSCPHMTKNVSYVGGKGKHLKTAISQCYTNNYKALGLKGDVLKLHCESNKPFYSKDVYDVLVGLCLILLVALVIFASIYEGRARYETTEEYNKITGTRFGTIISCFSLPKNWNRLASKSTGPDAAALSCINGVRFYNMFLVVLTHTCMTAFGTSLANPKFTEALLDDSTNMILVNGNYAVQTFFIVSGFLLSYYFFLAFEGRKNFKLRYILLVFVNRYIRLTPCLIVMISLNGTWLYHLNRGPFWDKIVGDEYRNCRKNWWANLLYINNYYDTQSMCLLHTWYLAADTQLFLLSLVIVTLMLKNQKHIKTILAGLFTIGLLVPGIVNYINSYDILIRQYPEPLHNLLVDAPEWNVIVVAAYTNLNGYVIGITAGYLFYKYRTKKIFTKKSYVVLWWIVTWTLPLSVIFIAIFFYREDYEYSRLGAAVYVAVGRTIFALGIGVGLFGITKGIGWFLYECVVWSPLQVLGRLTYCVYLVHVTLIRARAGQARSPIYMSNYFIFFQASSDLVVAYIFALILCLFVEMPTSALQKLVVPQLSNKRKEGVLEKSEELEEAVKSVDEDDQDSKI